MSILFPNFIRLKESNIKREDNERFIFQRLSFNEEVEGQTLDERFSKLKNSMNKQTKSKRECDEDSGENLDEGMDVSTDNYSDRQQNVLKCLAKKFKNRLQQNNTSFEKKFHSKDRKVFDPINKKSCGSGGRRGSGGGGLCKELLDYGIDYYMAQVKGPGFELPDNMD